MIKKIIFGFVAIFLVGNVSAQFVTPEKFSEYDNCIDYDDCEEKIQSIENLINKTVDNSEVVILKQKKITLSTIQLDYEEEDDVEEIEEVAGEYMSDEELKEKEQADNQKILDQLENNTTNQIIKDIENDSDIGLTYKKALAISQTFNQLSADKTKNQKLFKNTLIYFRDGYGLFEGEDINIEEINPENIDFMIDVYPKIQDKFLINDDIKKELDELANLFEKIAQNPQAEIRRALPNAGILPGSNTVGGVQYAKETVIPKFVNTLVVLGLSVSVLMLVIGGLLYVMSHGDDDQKGKAKNFILYAIVGVVISAISFGVVKLVIGINFNILGG